MPGKPFVRGQSGNPRGRPKKDRHIEALARAHTQAALDALVEALRDRRTRVAAACALLDRGWGKPRPPADVAEEPAVKTIYLLPGDEAL